MFLSLIKRVAALSAVSAAAVAALPATASAAYPDHPVTIVVPFATGTTPDLITRVLAASLEQQTGENFIVLNMVGASGIIGTSYVTRAKPDGYTIGFANVATMAINQSLYKSLPYNADTQLAPVSLIGTVQNILAVRNGLGVTTVQQLIDLAKKEPGKLVFASGGDGTTGHLSAEMFEHMVGINMVHVPYKGGPAADLSVVSGQTDLVFENTSSIMPFVQQKQVVPLAVTGLQRDPQFPNLPTLDSLGLKGYNAVAWMGYIAPAKTDPKVLDFLNNAINKAMQDPAVLAKIKVMDVIPFIGPRQALFDRAHKERPIWANVIKEANVHID